jgi:hypothetical protein
MPGSLRRITVITAQEWVEAIALGRNIFDRTQPYPADPHQSMPFSHSY